MEKVVMPNAGLGVRPSKWTHAARQAKCMTWKNITFQKYNT